AATWKGSPFQAGALAEPRPLVLPPYQSLTNGAQALGHNFLARDPDGIARSMSPFIVSDGKQLPSLGVATALIAAGFAPSDVAADGNMLRIGDRRVPMVHHRVGDHDQWSMLINYRAPARVKNAAGEFESPYPDYNFGQLFIAEQDILNGKKPSLDPS